MNIGNRTLKKDVLHDILRRCRLPKDQPQVAEFIPKLAQHVRIVWHSLAGDTVLDPDIWTLYSRVAIIGMYYLNWYHADEGFTKESYLQLIFQVIFKKEHRLMIRPAISFHVRNRAAFTSAMIYGLMSLVKYKPGLYSKKQLDSIYCTILDQCRCHSRYTTTYFLLMYSFVDSFVDSFTEDEAIDLMRLSYNNVERKDSVLIIKAILNAEKVNAEKIFNILLSKITWDNKYKFIILTEILSTNPNLMKFVNHEEFIRVIIEKQANPSLASPAGKLYSALVEEISEKLWSEKYYPAILEYIELERDVDNCHKNTFKYILIKTFKRFHLYFTEILNRKYEPGKMPIYSILNLTRIIIDNKFDKIYNINYNFMQMAENSYFHSNPEIRTMFFYILTKQDYNNKKIFELTQEFIVLNINDADNCSRDSIKKTFDIFIKDLLRTVVEVDNTPTELKNMSVELFNWLIKFLFNQFKPYSNYQRMALSFQMIYTIFLYIKELDKERRVKFLEKLDFYINSDDYVDLIINMLFYTNKEDSNNVVNLAVEMIPYSKFKSISSQLEKEGYENISSANIEISLRGERALDFVLKTLFMHGKYDQYKDMLRVLAARIAFQWIKIQESCNENIITKNVAFGALLTLVSKYIKDYHPIIIFTMIALAENIVEKLLEVFQIRAMIEFRGKVCFGIALAFAREHSRYHAVTVNTMWLALKGVCNLLLSLVKYMHNDYMIGRSLKCLKAIIRNCYHKGVLEVASATLSAIVTYYTSIRRNINVIELAVTNLLKEIPCVAASNSTVRRFAEKRLILCSIVLSDKRPGKPLYHKAMAQLCSFLSTEHPRFTKDGRCLVLHCLQPLLIDTQVEIHASEYYERIVFCILNNFQNRTWDIRNAALQAFGAISHKLLGCPTISNGITKRHSISVEELFYKFRNLYPVFIVQIKAAQTANNNFDLCKLLHSFTPVGCLLSMTYSRGDDIYPTNTPCITYISGLLIILLKIRTLPEESILIARAFTAICHPELIKKRIKLTMHDPVFKHSNFFGWLYLIKCLCDKLLAEASKLPEDPKPFVLTTTDEIINSIIVNKDNLTNDDRYACFVLYRIGVTAIGRNYIDYHFEYFCDKNPAEPYPQFWIDDLITELLMNENILDLRNIIEDILFYYFPLDLKVLCFKTLNTRILNNECDNKLLSDNYAATFITFLSEEKYWSKRIISEECINLILNLTISNKMEEDFTNAASKFVHNKSILPKYFCTVMFVVYQSQYVWNMMPISSELCLCCVNNCYETLASENPDDFILKSVIYISKYAKKYKYYNLLMICVDLTYKLLQSNEASLLEIGEKSLEILFQTKGTFPFANILYVIDNVQELVGNFNGLDFLGSKYWDQYIENAPLNAFEQKPIVKIHSNVLKERLLRNFNAVYDLLNNDERIQYYNRVLTKVSH